MAWLEVRKTQADPGIASRETGWSFTAEHLKKGENVIKPEHRPPFI